MLHKLTVNMSDEVYHGLHRVIGRGKIGRFLEDLARPHVVPDKQMTAAEGFGCAGYKGRYYTDEEVKRGLKSALRKKYSAEERKLLKGKQ